ncbi:hypothetical protein RIF29_14608 [Crotalaria pallida]|uniref:Uncharacterized protein n=1 Tax=Crotalaria pallida TaxID=3830 RepID=A0AAN9FBK9_CROPI
MWAGHRFVAHSLKRARPLNLRAFSGCPQAVRGLLKKRINWPKYATHYSTVLTQGIYTLSISQIRFFYHTHSLTIVVALLVAVPQESSLSSAQSSRSLCSLALLICSGSLLCSCPVRCCGSLVVDSSRFGCWWLVVPVARAAAASFLLRWLVLLLLRFFFTGWWLLQ